MDKDLEKETFGFVEVGGYGGSVVVASTLLMKVIKNHDLSRRTAFNGTGPALIPS